MGFFDWFRSRPAAETRSSGAGYTAAVMAARDSYITGRRGVAELTGTVQSCLGLWESAFAHADVEGAPFLNRRTMALIARSAGLRGEAVFLITATGLVPAVDWSLTTRDGQPRAYRLTLPEAGGGRSVTALAAEVLHLRIGADITAPWAGTSPLHRASLTGGMLHAVEAALAEVFENAPLGSLIVPLPDSGADDMDTLRHAFRARRGATLVVEGLAQATAAGMNPQLGQKPDQLSPDLSRSMTAETLAAARDGVMGAFGVLPALLNRSATGPVIREAQRHLATWQLQPMAELLAAEAESKIGGRVRIDVMRPMQAFDAGGRARAMSAIIGALADAKAAGIDPGLALHLTDWKRED